MSQDIVGIRKFKSKDRTMENNIKKSNKKENLSVSLKSMIKAKNKLDKPKKAEKKKKLILDWLKKSLDYDKSDNISFITLRYGLFNRPDEYEKSRDILRKIMRKVYEELYGRSWHKKLPKSIVIIEKGHKRYLHAHMIANLKTVSLESFSLAFDIVKKKDDELTDKKGYSKNRLNIDVVCWKTKAERDTHANQNYCPKKNDIVIEPVGQSLKNINRVIKYILKEYNFTRKKIDFSNFFNQDMLFRTNQ
jgi:hypothetical protein